MNYTIIITVLVSSAVDKIYFTAANENDLGNWTGTVTVY